MGSGRKQPNQRTPFAYLATVTDNGSTSYNFGKNMDQNYGTTAINEYAVDVSWEVADKTNIGLDMRLLNNKLSLQVDLFKESREGIYLRRKSIPSYFGMINNPYGNIGKVENKGIEVALNYANTWGRLVAQRHGQLLVQPQQGTRGRQYRSLSMAEHHRQQGGTAIRTRRAWTIREQGGDRRIPRTDGDTRPGDIKYKDINETA